MQDNKATQEPQIFKASHCPNMRLCSSTRYACTGKSFIIFSRRHSALELCPCPTGTLAPEVSSNGSAFAATDSIVADDVVGGMAADTTDWGTEALSVVVVGASGKALTPDCLDWWISTTVMVVLPATQPAARHLGVLPHCR